MLHFCIKPLLSQLCVYACFLFLWKCLETYGRQAPYELSTCITISLLSSYYLVLTIIYFCFCNIYPSAACPLQDPFIYYLLLAALHVYYRTALFLPHCLARFFQLATSSSFPPFVNVLLSFLANVKLNHGSFQSQTNIFQCLPFHLG